MNDILGVLKYKYKNINVSYKKVIPKARTNRCLLGSSENKNELFVTINNERLECNHSLEFYMQTVGNILNKVIK
ncbi:hypothetical protein [uncultured Brachyspira sp.]|uniref:hypothetical protein n=1 Tax=uncultured Brachyspira sp. TaxID=221953 RepID=UPI0025D55FE3|nr:hypothetical protein [uncultured Brachyspira sp.]